MAHVGVRTRNFSFAINGLPAPQEEFRIELAAPGGGTWAWGPKDAAQRVTGSAEAFCQVVTQRRDLTQVEPCRRRLRRADTGSVSPRPLPARPSAPLRPRSPRQEHADMTGHATPGQDRPLRVGNCSGFYGDRLAAVQEMLTEGPVDVLTGDYLAELTMAHPRPGPAGRPEPGLRRDLPASDARVPGHRHGTPGPRGHQRGRFQPTGAGRPPHRDRRTASASSPASPASTGDDLRHRAEDSTWAPPHSQRLPGGLRHRRGARTRGPTSSSPARHRRLTDGRPRRPTSAGRATDLDALAGATVAGHVIECGTQATGGNYAFFARTRRTC